MNQAVSRFLLGLFSPKGRLGPQGFWLGFAILSGVSIGAMFVPFVGGYLWLASIVLWIFLSARRLHDMNRSGWLQLVPVLLNIAILVAAMGLIGWAVFLTLFAAGPAQANLDLGSAAGASGFLLLSAGAAIFNTVWLVWLGSAPGNRDANRYGLPPGQTVAL